MDILTATLAVLVILLLITYIFVLSIVVKFAKAILSLLNVFK